tara:strand:+ start:351 stop:497 length:147 start_codon:yes stop_codon:yes gene_type:complete
MALEIEQDQDQAQPKRRIPTPDEVFGVKKKLHLQDIRLHHYHLKINLI